MMEPSVSNTGDCYLIVHNVAKKHNIGTLVRSAVALGVKQMILVGRRDFNSFGSHGSSDYMQFKHFHSLNEAKTYLKSNNCRILGVEITESAVPIHSHPFSGSTAFLVGNEGTGLSDKEMEICDGFVYISQYGSGTASLNVTVATSIVLHHFALWAGYQERDRNGGKFVVSERPVRRSARNVCPEDPQEVAERRKLKAISQEGDWLKNGEDLGGSNLFDEEI